MFCAKCGNKIEDGSRFCEYCGAPVNNMPEQPANTENYTANAQFTASKPEKKTGKVVKNVIIGIAIFAVAVLGIIFFLGYRTYKQWGYSKYSAPIDKYCRSVEKNDYMLYVGIQPEWWNKRDYYNSGQISRGMGYDEWLRDQESMEPDDIHNRIAEKYGNDFTLSYKIQKVKEVGTDELKKTQETWVSDWEESKDEMPEEDLQYLWDKPDIQNVYNVTYRLTVKGSKGSDSFSKSIPIMRDGDQLYCTQPDIIGDFFYY